MSVSMTVTMRGDFEKSENKAVVKDIAEAITEAIAKHGVTVNLGMVETKSELQVKYGFDDPEFRNNGKTHEVTLNCGFHVDPKPQ